MAARDEADRKAEARAFTDQVDALVSATLRGDSPPTDASEDAVRLAAAFVLLDRLVSQYAMLPLAANEGAVELYHRVGFEILRRFSAYVWERW